MTVSAVTLLRLAVIVLCCLCIQVTVANAEDVAVSVTLDRDTIGMDEQALLRITVSGESQDLPGPKMPTLPMFEMYSQGRSSNISIFNGKMESSVTYTYLVMPTKPGTFPISPIAVVYQNKRYKGNPVELTVLSGGTSVSPEISDRAKDSEGDTRDYFLEAFVDKENPYVNEQVTLTLKFYIAVKYSNPELTEPATTGFWTEVLGNKPPYVQRINGRQYRIIERRYALFPTQTGELTVGRATIRTTVVTRTTRRDPFDVFGDFFGRGKEVVVSSRPVTVKVKPLPTQDRPGDFTGTIGKFSISAGVDKTTVEVNQPVTLTVRIRGTGNIKSVAEPDIQELQDFRVYRASSNESISKTNDRIGGTKVFEEVFIPKRPGRLTIPAISFSYFDPQSGKYRETSTSAVSLTVTKPEGYIASSDLPYPGPDVTISGDARDIRFIKSDLGPVNRPGALILFSPIYIAANVIPIVAFAGLMIVRRRRQKLAGDIGYARRRSASKVAKRRLARARSLAAADSAGEFFAEIYTALTAYVADKLNISPHGLTAESIKELLRANSADEDLIADLEQVLGRCDFARFAPSSVTQQDIAESLATAESIITALEELRFA